MRELRGSASSIVLLLVLLQFSSALPSTRQKTSSSSNGSRVDDTLVFLGIVATHGNTAPLFDYSGNPYPTNSTSFWPFGAREVTSVGRNSLYGLGKNIRSLYNGFIDEEYDDGDFGLTSPEVDRAYISAQLFAAGLYPPVGYEVWNTRLPWQPIVATTDSSDNTLAITNCTRFLEEAEKNVANFESEYESKISNVTTYLSKSMGTNVSGVLGMVQVWEMLYSQDQEGLKLPEWASGVYPSPMKNLSGEYYKTYYAGSEESVRLVIGAFFEEIVTAMQKVQDKKQSLEYYQYLKEFESKVDSGPGPMPTGGGGGPTGAGPGPMPTGGGGGPTGAGPFPTGWGPFPTGSGGGGGWFIADYNTIFYSGYNASLITLQALLGKHTYEIVAPIHPGSAMIFELHKDSVTSDYSVQVVWIDGSLQELTPEVIEIPSCGTPCDFTTFVDITQKFTNIKNFTTECQTDV